MESNDAVTALAALAQGSRLAIFRCLVQAGPAGDYPSELAQRLQLPAATLSFHLKTLLQSGLIIATPSGRSIRYTANYSVMNQLIGYLAENCCGGASCAPGLCE